jgi:hypothetical protein
VRRSSLTKTKTWKKREAGCWWLTPVILATWKAEIRLVRSQPREIAHETLSQKSPTQNRLADWSSGRAPA